MKYNGFYNLDHVNAYLMGSVIRIEDDPVYVINLDYNGTMNKYKIAVRRLISKKEEWISLDDSRIVLAPVPLGMVNLKNENKRPTILVTARYPLRAWKIGLTSSNLFVTSILPHDQNLLNFNLFPSKELGKTIIGDFPSLSSILKVMGDKAEIGDTIAFSRHFAIRNLGKEELSLLYYRYNEAVGNFTFFGQPQLHPAFSFLREHLIEELKDE